MRKIKKLAPNEAQKIAAGEVVERPANVLKELLENAIDAQSSKITVYIKNGGKELLRVVDNGCGMSPEDAQLCFEQHATSKIAHVNELTSITTFGFRGEALASIAAVSKTTLITKEADSEQGTKIEIEANKIIKNAIVHANTGTDITITDLFYNVPARQKFLKTKETEWRQIQQLFFAFCIAHTHIDFKLYSEDKLFHNCPQVETIEGRIPQLFESTVAQHIRSVHHTHKQVTITGVISNHQFERYDRNMIYLFVNQRWVKDTTLSRAFIKGYHQVLPPGRYPAGCIFISVDPQEVDINIHPRKEEVQFLHPRSVQQAITNTVTQALEQHLSQQLHKTVRFRPSIPLEKPQPYVQTPNVNKPAANFNPFNFDQFLKKDSEKDDDEPCELHKHSPTDQQNIPQLNLQQTVRQSITPAVPEQEYMIVGQYNRTYLLLEQEDGLLMIDQHAAHERILYERFCAQHGNMPTIKLMFPQMITLTAHDLQTITEHVNLFAQYGIELEPFGTNTLKVQATPIQLKHAPMNEIIKDAIGYIHEYKELDQETFDQTMQKKLYADMACKAAVKAGDVLIQEQMKQLITDLYSTDKRFSCPHGRPTSWLLHHDEIKKKFKRDYRKQDQK